MKKTVLSLLFGLGCSLVGFSQTTTKIPADIEAILKKNTCLACHKVDTKLVGPSYKEVMKVKNYKAKQIVDLIYKPNPKNWPGYSAMAAMTNMPKAEAQKVAEWIVTLK